MNDMVRLALLATAAYAAGILLGAVFYGAWLTVDGIAYRIRSRNYQIGGAAR